MRIEIFTLFPEYFDAPLEVSLLGKARAAGLLDVRRHNPRDWATDAHRSVDEPPFGGGVGMVMMPGPLFAAVDAVQPVRPLFVLAPAGRTFDQSMARELAGTDGFSLICGRYEGIDQRVADHLSDGELSVGDFVVAGGEVAALVVVETVARLIPGVLGNESSSEHESFSTAILEEPQYTRPAEFRGWSVPDVLRSGDHGRVERWRRAQALRRTFERRPDLLDATSLDPADRALLEEFPVGE